MSFFAKLMIGGWLTTFAMFGFCALNESGKLRIVRQCVASWMETLASVVRASEESTQPEREDAA